MTSPCIGCSYEGNMIKCFASLDSEECVKRWNEWKKSLKEEAEIKMNEEKEYLFILVIKGIDDWVQDGDVRVMIVKNSKHNGDIIQKALYNNDDGFKEWLRINGVEVTQPIFLKNIDAIYHDSR